MFRSVRRVARRVRTSLLRVEVLEDRRVPSAAAAACANGPPDPPSHPTPPGLEHSQADQGDQDTQSGNPGNGIGAVVSGLAHDGVVGQSLADYIHQVLGRGNGAGDLGDVPPVESGGGPAGSGSAGNGGSALPPGGTTAAGSAASSATQALSEAATTATTVVVAPTAVVRASATPVAVSVPVGAVSAVQAVPVSAAAVQPAAVTVASAVTVPSADEPAAPAAPPAGPRSSAPAFAPAGASASVLTAPTVTRLGVTLADPVAPGVLDVGPRGGPEARAGGVVGSTTGGQEQAGARFEAPGPAPAVAAVVLGDEDAAAEPAPQGSDQPADLGGAPPLQEAGLLDNVFAGMAGLLDNPAVRSAAPWVAAGALAAVACEIARRQVSRGRTRVPGAVTALAPDDPAGPPPGDVP